MTEGWDPIELLMAADIAELLDVKRAQAHRLTHREDFPAPYAVTPRGFRLWKRADVALWAGRHADRRPGPRPRSE
jgi:predicted DNA-binding transcriptional regulator AlpA